jgi:hypothetical protein
MAILPRRMESALRLLREEDSFAAIAHLSQGEALAAAATFAELLVHLYWKEKDLDGAVAIGRAGAQFALRAAEEVESSDPQRAAELRSKAKAMCYNVASFTWPGWEEAGIAPTASDVRAGLDAAKANLRLARELNKGELPLARAFWMLGAQQLANGDRDAAPASFASSAAHAKTAGAESERLLVQGFCCLVELLCAPNGPDAQRKFVEVKGALAPLEHGADFVGQLETAWRVFSR